MKKKLVIPVNAGLARGIRTSEITIQVPREAIKVQVTFTLKLDEELQGFIDDLKSFLSEQGDGFLLEEVRTSLEFRRVAEHPDMRSIAIHALKSVLRRRSQTTIGDLRRALKDSDEDELPYRRIGEKRERFLRDIFS